MREPGKTATTIGVVVWFVVVAVLALNWVGDHLSDLASGEAFVDEAVAGEELDSADVPWLHNPPPRTRVDTEALRVALDELDAEVLLVLRVDAPTEVSTSSRFDYQTVIQSHQRVLTGASRSFELSAAVANEEFISKTAESLRAAGWQVSIESRPMILTEYPIVPPVPELRSITARSQRGVINVNVYNDSDRYGITYSVDESHLE